MTELAKNAIQQTFVQMLREGMPLSKITVQRLADRCGINRGTFYYHYASIDDLVESILEEDMERVVQSHPTVEGLLEYLDELLDFIYGNRRMLLGIYSSMGRATCEKYLWKVARSLVENYVEVLELDLEPADKEALILYYESLIFGLAMKWLRNGATESEARDMAERLIRIFRQPPRGIRLD